MVTGVFYLYGVGNIRIKWFLGLRKKNINHSSFLFLSLDKIELVIPKDCQFEAFQEFPIMAKK